MGSHNTPRTTSYNTSLFYKGRKSGKRYSPYPASPGSCSRSPYKTSVKSNRRSIRKSFSGVKLHSPSIFGPMNGYSHPQRTNNCKYHNRGRCRGTVQRWSNKNSSRKKRRINGPQDYSQYVRHDMVEDPWARFPNLSKTEKPGNFPASVVRFQVKEATTELSQQQMLKKSGMHGSVKIEIRQHCINDHQISLVAPSSNSVCHLRETSTASDKMESNIFNHIACETTSRLSSNQISVVANNLSMADVLLEFL